MNTLTTLDENSTKNEHLLGEQLASIRQEKGYTMEYVANKLNLRVYTIELIENNKFKLLPGPVFVKGYIRAYTKLLGVSPEPYLAVLATLSDTEIGAKKPERALLWQQSKPESYKAEYIIRWFTALFALGVIIAVGIWWQKNEDNQKLFAKSSAPVDLSLNQTSITETTDLKLTDISKMKSLLDPKSEISSLE